MCMKEEAVCIFKKYGFSPPVSCEILIDAANGMELFKSVV